MDNKFKKIRNILLVVLVFNWLVSLAKIIYGYITNASAMVADGFHSFSDGASNIIGIVGIFIASRPADKDHPYGHRKYETFASVTIASLLFFISFNLIKSAFARFMNPVIPEVNTLSFVIMIFTIIINSIVFRYEHKKSEELGSDVLHADSQHTRSDVLVSFSVICTLLAIRAGFPMIDTIVALVIAVLIGKSAVNILIDSSRVLCDMTPIMPDKIKDAAMQIQGVKEAHNIRTRGRPDDIYVDLHVLVDTSMHVGDAHDLAEKIENKIKDSVKGVTDVVVHIEPVATKH